VVRIDLRTCCELVGLNEKLYLLFVTYSMKFVDLSTRLSSPQQHVTSFCGRHIKVLKGQLCHMESVGIPFCFMVKGEYGKNKCTMAGLGGRKQN
jgi:hypothetical protein